MARYWSEETQAVMHSPRYPPGMMGDVSGVWKSQLLTRTESSLFQDVYAASLELNTSEEVQEQIDKGIEVRKEQLEQARRLLMRLHKAAGHPTNRALAKICRDRGMPRWVINEALNLSCQACLDTKRGEQLVTPVSVGTKPQPWQFLGMDVLELMFPKQKQKARYLLMIDMTMKFAAVEVLWQGPVQESGTDPGSRIMEVFSGTWLQHRPRPEWALCDPQTSIAFGDFNEFLHSIGIGMTVTAGEAHWQLGGVEVSVRTIKKVMKRLRNEKEDMNPKMVGYLAAMANNHTIKTKGSQRSSGHTEQIQMPMERKLTH